MRQGTVRTVSERRVEAGIPLWSQPEWRERFPWLVQGCTGRGRHGEVFDLGLYSEQPVGRVLGRWRRLQETLTMPAAVHARQVHGADLWLHEGPPVPGLQLMAGFDGHLTSRPALLLTVSVADCMPVALVDEESRAIALLHAGWRGVAAGILEAAVLRMRREFGSRPASLWLHAGPSICGACYEVGPEVHRAVRRSAEVPDVATPLDLRAELLDRAVAAGLAVERCSASGHCTGQLCSSCEDLGGGRDFFSFRAGHAGRQMGVLGIRG